MTAACIPTNAHYFTQLPERCRQVRPHSPERVLQRGPAPAPGNLGPLLHLCSPQGPRVPRIPARYPAGARGLETNVFNRFQFEIA